MAEFFKTIDESNKSASDNLQQSGDALTSINSNINQINNQVSQLNQVVSNIDLNNLDISGTLKNNIVAIEDFVHVAKNRLGEINDLSSNLLKIDPNQQNEYKNAIDNLKTMFDQFKNDFNQNFNLSQKIIDEISKSEGSAKSLESTFSGIMNIMTEMGRSIPNDQFNALLNIVKEIKNVSDATDLAGKTQATAEQLERGAFYAKAFQTTFDELNNSVSKSKDEVVQLYNAVGELSKLSSTGFSSNTNFAHMFGDASKMEDLVTNLSKSLDFEGQATTPQGIDNLLNAVNQLQNGFQALLNERQRSLTEMTKVIDGENGAFLNKMYNTVGSVFNAQSRDNSAMQQMLQDTIDQMKSAGESNAEFQSKIKSLEQDLSNLKQNGQNQIISNKTDVQTGLFGAIMDKTNVENDPYSRMLEIGLANKRRDSYEQYINAVGGSAHHLGTSAEDLSLEMGSNYSHLTTRQKLQTKMQLGNPEQIAQQAGDIEKSISAFNKLKSGVTEQIRNGDSPENIEKEMKALINYSKELNDKVMNTGSLVKVYDKEEFNKLPKEAQEVVKQIQNIFKITQDSNREIIGMGKAFGVNTEEIEKTNKELDKMEANLDQSTGKAESFVGKFKNGISDFLSPLSTLATIAGAIGIGGLSFGNYVGGSANYYKQQGMMDVESYRADIGLGAQYDAAAARDRSINKALDYHRASNGLIGFEEYNKGYTNLARNVGGQQGISGEQASADLNAINEGTFALSKVYGISDSTIANATKVFYQDLKMSAKETSDSINEMVQSARSANIPVDKYVNQIAALAENYKNAGLTGKDAMSVMDNLLTAGLTYNAASSLAGAVPGAMSTFSQNTGLSAYAGMMSGQYPDWMSAAWGAVDRWDKDGEVKDTWADSMAQSMDYMTGVYSGISGQNDDFQKLSIYKMMMQNYGMKTQDAAMATNLYFDDKVGFQDFIKDYDVDGTQSQDDLITQIKNLADVMSETQKSEAIVEESKYETAENLIKELSETFLPSLQETIKELNDVLQSSIGKLVDVIGGITDSKLGQAYGESFSSHPLITGGLTLGAYGIAKKGMGAVGDGAINAVKGLFTGGAASKIDDVAEGVAEGAGVASKGLSKYGDDIVKMLGKGKKYALPAAAVAATIYAGSKLLGSDDEEENIYDTSGYSGEASGNGLYNRVTDIYNLLLAQFTGTELPAAGSYAASAPTNTSTPVKDKTAYSMDEDDVEDEMTRSAGVLAATVVGTKTAEKMILKTAGKGVPKWALKGGLKATAGIATAGAADAIYYGADLASHYIKGDNVKEDPGNALAGLLTDGSWTMAGAAVGSVVPGVGTAVGAIGGFIAQQIVDYMTKDESGQGVVTKSKDGLTKLFTGKTEEQIQQKRDVLNNDQLMSYYKSSGLTKDQIETVLDKMIENNVELNEKNIVNYMNDPEYKGIIKNQEQKLTDIATNGTDTVETIRYQSQQVVDAIKGMNLTVTGNTSTNTDREYNYTDIDVKTLRNSSYISDKNVVGNKFDELLKGGLKGYGQDFVNAGEKYGVDPALLASISMLETGNGKSMYGNNISGSMIGGQKMIFESVEQSIDMMAKNLKNNYIDKGLDTIPEIQQKYAPLYASNDPTHLNFNWLNNVNSFYDRFSPALNPSTGTPGNNLYIGSGMSPNVNNGYNPQTAAYEASAAAYATQTSSKTIGQTMVDVAAKQIGAPYVLGSEGAVDWDKDGETTAAFDCSGLVSYAANMAGLNIGRLQAKDLYSEKYSQPISADQLQPGDLGFVLDGVEVKHVGVYDGSEWIHAALDNSLGINSVVKNKFGEWTSYRRLKGSNYAAGTNLDISNIMSMGGSSGSSGGSSASTSGATDGLAWGRMLYGIMPSTNSSYFNNDSTSSTNYLDITKKILNSGGVGGFAIGDTQGMARSARVKLDSGLYDSYAEDPYAESIDSISSTYKNDLSYSSSSSKNKYDVNVNVSGDSGSSSFRKLIDGIVELVNSLGDEVSIMDERLSNTEESVGSLGTNLSGTNKAVYDLQ